MSNKARMEVDARQWVACELCGQDYNRYRWTAEVAGMKVCIHCHGRFRWVVPYVQFVRSFAKDVCEDLALGNVHTEEDPTCGKCDPCTARKIVALHAKLIGSKE